MNLGKRHRLVYHLQIQIPVVGASLERLFPGSNYQGRISVKPCAPLVEGHHSQFRFKDPGDAKVAERLYPSSDPNVSGTPHQMKRPIERSESERFVNFRSRDAPISLSKFLPGWVGDRGGAIQEQSQANHSNSSHSTEPGNPLCSVRQELRFGAESQDKQSREHSSQPVSRHVNKRVAEKG